MYDDILRVNAEKVQRLYNGLELSQALMVLVRREAPLLCTARQFCYEFGESYAEVIEEAMSTGRPVVSGTFNFYARGTKDRLYVYDVRNVNGLHYEIVME